MKTEQLSASPISRPASSPSHLPPPPPPKPRSARKPGRWRKGLPWLAAIALAGAVIYGLSPKPLPVESGAVTHGPLTVSVYEEGKTRIRHRYSISPSVGGRLQRIELRPGDRIEAGKTVLATVLAEPASLLDPRSGSEAEAHVKAAEAALSQRQADLERAQAANDMAAREMARAIPLRKSGAISTKQWDQAETDAAMRGRELRSAEFGLQVAKFELQQAQAALFQAQRGPQDSGEPYTVLAPITGYVLNVSEESSRVIPPGTPVMEVGDTNDLEAEIELLSTDAAAVRKGAEATIERWGGPKPLLATVSMIEPAAFTKVSALGVEEQRVKVRVQFNHPEDAQPLGDRYRVEARIVVWTSPDVLQVPTGALFRRGGDWMCFLIEHGRARLRKVEIGNNNGLQAEVLGGLSAGEQVIIHPPDVVTPDASVTVRDR